MNKVNFPDMKKVETEAANWVAAIDRGLAKHEEEQLNAWLQSASVNGEALVKIASMWDLLDVLEPINKLMPIEMVDLDKPIQTNQKIKSRKSLIFSGWASAIAIPAMLLLAWGFWLVIPGSPKETMQSNHLVDTKQNTRQGKQYKTAVGEQLSVALEDGSLMQLNTHSEVYVRYDQLQRHIVLVAGEVFFDVAKNPYRPFTVSVANEQVTAIGTAFNIDTTSRLRTEVLVTEGQVRVNRTNSKHVYQDVFLTQGQKALITESQQPEVINDVDSESQLAWRQGMIIFEGETLAEVIKEINRYTPLTFRTADEEVGSIAVGGYFQTGDMEQLLLVLEQNFGIQSARVGNQVVLSKKPK